MKTCEMLSTLRDNPRLKAILKDDILDRKYMVCVAQDGDFYAMRNDEVRTNLILNTDDEWEVVQEAVSWQEALQAWSEGKSIKLECIDGSVVGEFVTLILAREDLTSGKWFILD